MQEVGNALGDGGGAVSIAGLTIIFQRNRHREHRVEGGLVIKEEEAAEITGQRARGGGAGEDASHLRGGGRKGGGGIRGKELEGGYDHICEDGSKLGLEGGSAGSRVIVVIVGLRAGTGETGL